MENKKYKSYSINLFYGDKLLYYKQKEFYYGVIDKDNNDSIEFVNKETIKGVKEDVIRHIDNWIGLLTGKWFLNDLNAFQSNIDNCEKTVFKSKFEFPIYFYNILLQKYNKDLKLTENLK